MHGRRHAEIIFELDGEGALPPAPVRYLWIIALCLTLLGHPAVAQNSTAPGGVLRTDRADLPTAINQPPDAVAQMRARVVRSRQQLLDAANADRIQHIADETSKLLLLARDLQNQIDKIGTRPLPKLLIREAEIIEKLAHDVQARMTVTVGSG
jgi:hypothetical protein